mmetsp:Transcript_24354/g.35674  ORF Transcript_24354/g.35674 Transcript_24354/m.35674 type:complete len:216 (-) Transcript_24354:108-755(-)
MYTGGPPTAVGFRRAQITGLHVGFRLAQIYTADAHEHKKRYDQPDRERGGCGVLSRACIQCGLNAWRRRQAIHIHVLHVDHQDIEDICCAAHAVCWEIGRSAHRAHSRNIAWANRQQGQESQYCVAPREDRWMCFGPRFCLRVGTMVGMIIGPNPHSVHHPVGLSRVVAYCSKAPQAEVPFVLPFFLLSALPSSPPFGFVRTIVPRALWPGSLLP